MASNFNSFSNKKVTSAKTPIKKNDTKAAVRTPGTTHSEKRVEACFFKTPTPHSNNVQKSTPRTGVSRVQTPGSCSMSKSKSTPVISEKYVNLLKAKEKPFVTPVTHLCSPSLSPKGRRHFVQHNKCSVKRFLSDSSLNDSPVINNTDVATPGSNQHLEEETSNFVVGVRVRPFNLRELSDSNVKNVVQMSQDEVQVTCSTGAIHSFTYDHCFWSFDSNHPQQATQETIFNTMVMPLIDEVLLGYNACLLAYGQTGSGKSYSMMGLDSGVPGELGKESGVIPRFFQELFKRITVIEEQGGDCHVEISYFEIYNEKIHDLLGNHSNHTLRRTLKVREHPTFGPYVVDLSAHCVRSFKDVQDWITVGNSQRVTAATGMNEKSSRSHSIFSIMVTQKEKEGSLLSCKSKVNLVDLAGSERVAQTCATGDKLKEGVSINKSLLSLGKVITFLSEKGRRKAVTSFGPYRESVLTWLLRESLGGNSRTGMLATISPANIHVDETLATLRYACQARTIVNRVYKNEDANERVIRELRAEVEKITTLREELDRMKKMVEYSNTKEKQDEIDRLKKQLTESEELLAKSQLSWAERLQEAENLKTAELQYLKRCGVTVELHCDKKTPCLVNLAADPMLTGTLMYLLPPGRLVIGRSMEPHSHEKQPDIGLSGPLIHPRHCEIDNRDGRLFLTPIEGCDTYINGRVANTETELRHKDRVVFGGIHYFRVSIPNQSEGSTNELVDFDFAHEEILKIQEKRLREELEESKQKALSELEAEMESLLGAQKFDYERQISEMLSVVEMQTNALAAERKEKNVLEMERNVLQERMKNQDSSREMMMDAQKNARKISPYKSTFLRDLKTILEGGSFEWNRADDSQEEISLHEMQVMVQEGTQRCKELGLNYEFQQQQVFGAKGLNPVVKVVNKDEGMATLWKPHKFTTLIGLLRENDHTFENEDQFDILHVKKRETKPKEGNLRKSSNEEEHGFGMVRIRSEFFENDRYENHIVEGEVKKMLKNPNLKWESDGSEVKEKSISVNTDYFKKRLSKNFQQQMKESPFAEGENLPESVSACLEEMKAKALNLAHACLTESSAPKLRERLKKAMKYFDTFLSVIQGDDSVSLNLTVPVLEMTPNDKSGKSVRFSGVS